MKMINNENVEKNKSQHFLNFRDINIGNIMVGIFTSLIAVCISGYIVILANSESIPESIKIIVTQDDKKPISNDTKQKPHKFEAIVTFSRDANVKDYVVVAFERPFDSQADSNLYYIEHTNDNNKTEPHLCELKPQKDDEKKAECTMDIYIGTEENKQINRYDIYGVVLEKNKAITLATEFYKEKENNSYTFDISNLTENARVSSPSTTRISWENLHKQKDNKSNE